MHPSATPRYFVVHSLVWIGLSTGLGYQHAQENNPSAAVVDTQPSGQQAEGAVVNLDLPTVAEASKYTATANGVEVEAFLRRLTSVWKGSELTTIGRTVEGRPLWALVVEPQVKSESKPLTVLIIGGIHAGECDGKEAMLALARDLAGGKHEKWWQGLRLIFVPNFNADGNERRGLLHRPGQAGPEAGMGLRENAQGLDLNRDFIKLETPEVSSLVAAFNRFDVDVFVDMHTTNGSLHRYPLTYDIPHNPSASQTIDRWLRGNLIPTLTERMEQAGFDSFYYGNFDAEHRRWETYGHEARYSTEYMGLRGRIGILVESYSYASYQRRVEASYSFVRELLFSLTEQAVEVRNLIDQATVEPHVGQLLALDAKLAPTGPAVTVRGYQQANGAPPKGPYGPDSTATLSPKDYTVQLWNRAEAVNSVTLPHAYAIGEQYAWAVSHLANHGVQVKRLKNDIQTKTEYFDIFSAKRAKPFQGHPLLDVDAKVVSAEAILPAGTFIVETTQPLGLLAAHMLEPEANDSLTVWNFFDPDVEVGQRFPVQRIVQALPAESLTALDQIPATETLTLEHLYAPGKTTEYSGSPVRGASWIGDSVEYAVRRDEATFAVDAASGAMRPIEELRTLAQKLGTLAAFTVENARAAASLKSFSADRMHALVPHRRDLYYFDAKSGAARQLTHSETEDEEFAELSPDGKHVAFLRDNNLWVVATESTELKQLTKDGTEELLNGKLDWVYQEELYGRGNFKAYWWSPDSRQIAFLQLDQAPVLHYQVSDSISFRQQLEDTRYPKAGDPLPIARMWIVDIASGAVQPVDLSGFDEADRLIARVTWSPTNELWLQVFNRVQNKQAVVRVERDSGKATTLFTESTEGWIEVLGTPEFVANGDFLWLSDLPNGRRHLYLVSATTGKRTTLTSGDWEVDNLLSVSSDKSTAFVSGNISHPTETQLIAVDLQRASFHQLTSAPGTHRVAVDASGKYFIDVFSNWTTPPVASVHSIDGQLLRVLEAPTSDRYRTLNIQPPLATTIQARDGLALQALIMLPNGVDLQDSTKKLPVVFHVYGGPQAPTVKNVWAGTSYWWHQMLCQKGFAVVLCDNRSSRGRGIKDTWSIRKDLGRIELNDLEDAVKWVSAQPWADGERIGLWGWSYGGYFTSYALTHSKLFRAGIAGAPVTDWRNYDAIYTERYMDLPKDNYEGYKSSSVVEAASNLSGRLLLIHGERDDNVHLSNTLQFADALQNVGKQFDLMVYPKNRHGIADPQQRAHMQEMMTDFFIRNLMKD
jgi:dipeptidyl-peptidase 4